MRENIEANRGEIPCPLLQQNRSWIYGDCIVFWLILTSFIQSDSFNIKFSYVHNSLFYFHNYHFVFYYFVFVPILQFPPRLHFKWLSLPHNPFEESKLLLYITQQSLRNLLSTSFYTLHVQRLIEFFLLDWYLIHHVFSCLSSFSTLHILTSQILKAGRQLYCLFYNTYIWYIFFISNNHSFVNPHALFFTSASFFRRFVTWLRSITISSKLIHWIAFPSSIAGLSIVIAVSL